MYAVYSIVLNCVVLELGFVVYIMFWYGIFLCYVFIYVYLYVCMCECMNAYDVWE